MTAMGPSISLPGSPAESSRGSKPRAVTMAVINTGVKHSGHAPRLAAPGLTLVPYVVFIVIPGADPEQRHEPDQRAPESVARIPPTRETRQVHEDQHRVESIPSTGSTPVWFRSGGSRGLHEKCPRLKCDCRQHAKVHQGWAGAAVVAISTRQSAAYLDPRSYWPFAFSSLLRGEYQWPIARVTHACRKGTNYCGIVTSWLRPLGSGRLS